MTTCNGASVNRAARCGERKTFEFRKSREETILNPKTCARCSIYVIFIIIHLFQYKLLYIQYIYFALIGIWNPVSSNDALKVKLI